MLSYILPFVILILVVVFIHEYGHYYFAKKYGVGITDFSIGFGQEIFGWNDKSGTRWKICWIPLGGYVKFFGDRNVFSQADQEKIIQKYNEEDRKKLFVLKPLYQRVLIVFGGPLANFLLALVIFFSIYTFIGKDFTPAVINEVQKDSPAMVGGLKDNDIILEIDGNKVKSIMDVSKYIMMSTDDFIDFKVKRSYDELLLKIKPNIVSGEDNLGNKINKRIVGIKLGAYNNEINHVKLGPAQAIYHAAHEVYYVSISSLKYIGAMIFGKAIPKITGMKVWVIDGGKDWKDGNRLLGDGKSWNGLLGGPLLSGFLTMLATYLWNGNGLESKPFYDPLMAMHHINPWWRCYNQAAGAALQVDVMQLSVVVTVE